MCLDKLDVSSVMCWAVGTKFTTCSKPPIDRLQGPKLELHFVPKVSWFSGRIGHGPGLSSATIKSFGEEVDKQKQKHNDGEPRGERPQAGFAASLVVLATAHGLRMYCSSADATSTYEYWSLDGMPSNPAMYILTEIAT
jgi:hypothetical protein